MLKRDIEYLRKRHIRSERIAEIREVKDALVTQGSHSRVSRTVARWFRRQGFGAEPKNRSGMYWHVWVKK